jgi:hypothetical protein
LNPIEWVSKLIAAPAEVAGRAYDSYLKAKTREDELADAKHQRNVELIRESGAAEAAWNQKALDNVGWKDEYWTIALSIPMFAVFCPWLVGYVREGFAVLETLPDWYKGAVGLMIGASFGYRKYTDLVMTKAFRTPKEPQ